MYAAIATTQSIKASPMADRNCEISIDKLNKAYEEMDNNSAPQNMN